MTFLQDYRALERKFKDQVKKDNEYFEPKVTEWKDSYYLPNIKPKGPVDFFWWRWNHRTVPEEMTARWSRPGTL